ncbi:MAG: hypothetical protein KC656_20405, partial [Myxococcales bacterium]|nr:hypothetical protein [Myxococcales bacterium]
DPDEGATAWISMTGTFQATDSREALLMPIYTGLQIVDKIVVTREAIGCLITIDAPFLRGMAGEDMALLIDDVGIDITYACAFSDGDAADAALTRLESELPILRYMSEPKDFQLSLVGLTAIERLVMARRYEPLAELASWDREGAALSWREAQLDTRCSAGDTSACDALDLLRSPDAAVFDWSTTMDVESDASPEQTRLLLDDTLRDFQFHFSAQDDEQPWLPGPLGDSVPQGVKMTAVFVPHPTVDLDSVQYDFRARWTFEDSAAMVDILDAVESDPPALDLYHLFDDGSIIYDDYTQTGKSCNAASTDPADLWVWGDDTFLLDGYTRDWGATFEVCDATPSLLSGGTSGRDASFQITVDVPPAGTATTYEAGLQCGNAESDVFGFTSEAADRWTYGCH